MLCFIMFVARSHMQNLQGLGCYTWVYPDEYSMISEIMV